MTLHTKFQCISIYFARDVCSFMDHIFWFMFFFVFVFQITQDKSSTHMKMFVVMTNWKEFLGWFTLPKHKNFNIGKFTTKITPYQRLILYSAVHTPASKKLIMICNTLFLLNYFFSVLRYIEQSIENVHFTDQSTDNGQC